MVAIDVDRSPGRKFIRRDLPTGFRLCLAEYEPGVISERRTCPDGQFWFIVRGGWRLTDTHEQVYYDGPLTLRYFRPFEQNSRVIGYSGARLFGIQIPNRLLREVDRMDCGKLLDLQVATRMISQLTRDFQIIENEEIHLLEDITRRLLALLTFDRHQVGRAQDRWINHVQNYLFQNRNRTVTMKELAAQVDIHPAYLGAIFNKTQGCTVAEYLRRLRLQDAAKKLTETNDEIGQIGVDAGFYDHAHFDRVFRSYLGMAPKEFRRLASRGPKSV